MERLLFSEQPKNSVLATMSTVEYAAANDTTANHTFNNQCSVKAYAGSIENDDGEIKFSVPFCSIPFNESDN